MTENTGKQATILRRLLILVFIIGGLMYSFSLLEYTLFHLTGYSPWPIDRQYTTLNEAEWRQEILTCQSPLFAAMGVTTEQAGLPILARCGRFWPFYHYQVKLPASSWIPGAFVIHASETSEDIAAREAFVMQMRAIHGGFALVAIFVLALNLWSLFQGLSRKNEEAAYKAAFQGFISSLLMMAGFTGLMFFVDPTFGLGW